MLEEKYHLMLCKRRSKFSSCRILHGKQMQWQSQANVSMETFLSPSQDSKTPFVPHRTLQNPSPASPVRLMWQQASTYSACSLMGTFIISKSSTEAPATVRNSHTLLPRVSLLIATFHSWLVCSSRLDFSVNLNKRLQCQQDRYSVLLLWKGLCKIKYECLELMEALTATNSQHVIHVRKCSQHLKSHTQKF